MSNHPESPRSKFHALLHDQIRHEFNAEHQYIAIAVWYDNADLPQLAKRFYAQSVEERNHAMMIVRYFLDRDISIELTGVDSAKSHFENAREPIALALEQEKTVTDQIVQLASTAREEGDYLGEQFMQWFLKEQVEEVASMSDLLKVVERSADTPMHIEDYLAREHPGNAGESDPTAPSPAGGAV